MSYDPQKLLTPERVIRLAGRTKGEVLDELVGALATSPLVGDPKELREKILEREKVMSTGVGMGIAIPHVKIASVRDFVMAVGLSAEGVDFESLDRSPTRIVVMIACNNSQAADFLKVLSKVAGGLRTPAAQEKLLLAPTPADVVAALCGPGGLLA